VDKTGTVKILDMGLARFSDETQGSLTVAYDQKMIGTVDYLAPEQALNSHNVDARVDIYSLGCTLYFLLTGDAPFPEGTISQRLMRHQTAEPTDVRKTRPDAPEALLRICRKMIAKAASDRYQTADDVALALAEWLEQGADGAASLQSPPPSGPSQTTT
jgi:serine/threonine-protein kinase